MNAQTVIELQQAIEEETVSRGVDRFIKRTQKKSKREGFDKLDEVQALIRGCVPVLAEGLQEWLDAHKDAKGRKPAALKALEVIDLDKAAAIGTTAIFHHMADEGKLAVIASTIGRRIEIELEALAIEAANPKDAARFLKMAEGDVTARALEARFERLVSDHEAALMWSDNTRVLVGQVIINVALTKLGELFVSKTVRKSKSQSQAIIELTSEAAEALFEMQDAASLRHLPLRPMIVEPRQWEHMTSGAYLDFRLSRLADSDDAAQPFRSEAAHHSELMPPGC